MRLLLCALVSGALVAPAASAAEPEWRGFECGWTSVNDFSGQLDPDPDRQYGYIHGGPLVVSSPDVSAPVISATLTCAIQVEQWDYAAADDVSVSATGSAGVVVLAPTAMTYRVAPAQNVYYCTTVSAVTRNGTYTWNVDYDDWLPGSQCGLAVSPG